MTTIRGRNTAPCVYQHFSTLATMDASATFVTALPPIAGEKSIFTDGSYFLEGIESIMDGVTTVLDAHVVLEEYKNAYYQKGSRGSTPSMMTPGEIEGRQQIHSNHQTHSLRERMEAHLENELARPCKLEDDREEKEHNDIDSSYPPRASIDSIRTGEDIANVNTTRPINTCTTPNTSTMVWDIQPLYDVDNAAPDSLRFKFTTNTGACLILKVYEALSWIAIMKKYSEKSSCATFFQVYSVDGRESLIASAEDIPSIMRKVFVGCQPELEVEDFMSGGAKTGPRGRRSRSGHRFIQYMRRRRCKRLIRRQVDIALGEAPKSRGWPGLGLFFLISRVDFCLGTTL